MMILVFGILLEMEFIKIMIGEREVESVWTSKFFKPFPSGFFMNLNDYEFDLFHKLRLRHLQKHIEGNRRWGSFFDKRIIPNAHYLATFAFDYLKDYDGERFEVEVDLPYLIGYDGVVCLDNLPDGARVDYEVQTRSIPIKIVIDMSRQPTNRLVVVAGPLRGRGKGNGDPLVHGYYTVFCGQSTPPRPVSRKSLIRRFQGADLKQALSERKKSLDFWRRHGLIGD